MRSYELITWGRARSSTIKGALRSAFRSFVIWMQVTIVVFATNISVQLTTAHMDDDPQSNVSDTETVDYSKPVPDCCKLEKSPTLVSNFKSGHKFASYSEILENALEARKIFIQNLFAQVEDEND